MDYLKKFLKNLALLIGIFLFLLVVSPTMMSGVVEVYGAVFGPVAVLILIGAALPNQGSKKSAK